MRILVVDDDARVARAVTRGLETEGFAVDVAADGTEGEWLAKEFAYDALVLDVMLPGVDGFELCRRLRQAGNWTPILMLTAKNGAEDEVHALDTGADDFLAKPFSFGVLVARIRALLRRHGDEPDSLGTQPTPSSVAC
jgi:DNA-binding response OmpR family regulator